MSCFGVTSIMLRHQQEGASSGLRAKPGATTSQRDPVEAGVEALPNRATGNNSRDPVAARVAALPNRAIDKNNNRDPVVARVVALPHRATDLMKLLICFSKYHEVEIQFPGAKCLIMESFRRYLITVPRLFSDGRFSDGRISDGRISD